MKVRVNQESQALVSICAGNNRGLEMESSAAGSCFPSRFGSVPCNGVDGGNNFPGPMQKVPSSRSLQC